MKYLLLAFNLFFSFISTNSNYFIIPEPEFGSEFETEFEECYFKSDIHLMARVVMSEASTLNFMGKQAVAEVILNRVASDKYPDNIYDVIYQENAFSISNNGEPTEECYDAILFAIQYNAFPDDMYWFRNNYVQYGYECLVVGNMYFSTETKSY